MNINEKIKYYAEQKSFTQYGLAKATGLSQPFIGKLFKGEKSPSLETLTSICSAFGITLEEFFSENIQIDSKEQELLSVFRSLNEDKQEIGIRILKALK